LTTSRIEQWNERYRAGEQVFREPVPLVVEFTRDLGPGDALDLAAGPGRNAVYLAGRGWRVTAIDGSSVAIDLLVSRGFNIDARVSDLEAGQFTIPSKAFDLVLCCYYLQRDLIPAMKEAVRPGGVLILITHLADADQPQGTATRAFPSELRKLFEDWRMLHYREGEPSECCHRRAVAEVVAQRVR
jgi:SAM-dependent methyltransferase